MNHVEQISIFLENKAGRLAEVTRILADARVNIRALSLADTSDFGILRLIVSDTEKAKSELRAKGFTVGKTEVLAVEVPDLPGGLHQVLKTLQKADVNIEYMYAFVHEPGKTAVIVFRFDNLNEGLKFFMENGVKIIDREMLYSM